MIIDQAPLVILTGANGWLGHRLALALTKGDAEMKDVGAGGRRLRCLIQAGEPTQALLSLGAEIVQGDIRDPSVCQTLCRDAEGAVVIHTAGIIHPPGKTRWFDEVNLGGAQTLLQAARQGGVRRMVAVSSNSPFGANPTREHRFDETSPYNPYMGYGRSKRRMEEFLLGEAQTSRPEIVIIRAPWFYGPGQPPRQSQFYTMIKKGVFPLMGDGLNRRSMAYVDSLALGCLLAADRPDAAGRCYWIADSEPYTMLQVIETVRTVLAEDFGMTVSPRILKVPGLIADCARLADTALQAAGLYHQKIHVLSEMNLTIACDIGRAKAELGYEPLVDLREGHRRSVAWCLDHGIAL